MRGLASSCLLCFATFAFGCSATVTDLGPSDANPLDSEEAALLSEFQGWRVAQGLPAVNGCAVLNVSAAAHADDMRDNGDIGDVGSDGSSVRTRACNVGYQPACGSAGVAEAVASGNDMAQAVLTQWETDAKTKPVISNPDLIVVGIGRSEGPDQPYWSMDLGSADDPSCAQ
jgi:uncharacterized protein YkwD